MEKMTSLDRMKKENEKNILRVVHENPGIYRKLIATKTGLSSQTITNLVTEMLERNMLLEHVQLPGTRGRTPVSLEINYGSFHLVTVEVTSRRLLACLHSLDETTVVCEECVLQRGEDVLRRLKELLEHVCVQAPQTRRVQALVVSVTGVVNEETGMVVHAETLNWSNLNLREELSYLGYPVLVCNDVNLIAYYEKARHQGEMNFMVAKLDVGIGASFVLGSRVLRTANNAVGELGHVTVACEEERPCACGKTNCLTQFISQEALEETYGQPYETLVEDVHKGKTEAISRIEKLCSHLALVLANVITLLDLDRVILCGSTTNDFREVLHPCLDKRIRRLLSYWVSFKGLEIHDRAGIAEIGACFWMDMFFSSDDMEFAIEGE